MTHERLLEPPGAEDLRVAVGRPLDNLRLHLVDRRSLELLPVGASGELYVGGVGVGRGYLGESVRTVQSWVPDPFSSAAGSRLYRTGDLARLRPSGKIEFLGRVDHQVKIRGHRIELGEIETVLGSHPSVRAAVVEVREEEGGNRRLVAYVVPRAEQEGEERDQAQVGQWAAVFDEVYGGEEYSEQDSEVNLRAWMNSYTRSPLPEVEIFCCFEDSVARIEALRSRDHRRGCWKSVAARACCCCASRRTARATWVPTSLGRRCRR